MCDTDGEWDWFRKDSKKNLVGTKSFKVTHFAH